MRKVIDFGKVDYNGSGRKNCRVTIEVQLENGRLSMVGNIWNPRETDVYSCGQNYEEIARLFAHSPKVRRMVEVWERWHLNDLRAGCAHQRTDAALQGLGKTCPTCGYAYGSKWLREELPSDISAEVESW